MLPDNEPEHGAFRETILKALNDERMAASIHDEALYSTIGKEMERGEYDMDTELIDACTQLLWNRHSAMTPGQLEKKERRSFKRFRRYMKRSAAPPRPKRFPLRPVAVAAMVLFLVVSPMLFENQPFRIVMPDHEEQYIVAGIPKNDAGIARAGMSRDAAGMMVELDSLEEVAPHLGYAIELPTWLPEGCSLQKIILDRDVAYDALFVKYVGNENESITIEITNYDNREGHSTSYEQEKKGRQLSLQNGASVYVANNTDSVWGLYQSSNMDYWIDAYGFDEATLMRVFNSIRR